MDKTENRQTAVIGCGLSGTALFTALVDNMVAKDLHDPISLFQNKGKCGAGEVYRTEQPDYFLLNHEADNMGALNGGKNGFLNWIQANRDELSEIYRSGMDKGLIPRDEKDGKIRVGPGEYYPRNLFGRFLSAQFDEAMEKAREHGILVNVQNVKVSDIEDKEHFAIVTYQKDGHEVKEDFGRLALTMGYWTPTQESRFSGTKRYLPTVYNDQLYGDNPPFFSDADRPRTLLVKGTGLSANDTVFHALETGSADKAIMFSRRGQLRAVRGHVEPYTLQVMTPAAIKQLTQDGKALKLDDVLRLFELEMEVANGRKVKIPDDVHKTLEIVPRDNWEKIFHPRPSELKGWLADQIKSAESGKEQRWRSVLFALIDVREDIYQRLAPEDKKRFIDEYSTLYFSYQAAMPLPSAKKLLHYMDEGKLEVVSGVQAVTWDNKNKLFEVHTAFDKRGGPVLTHGKEPTDALPEGAQNAVYTGDFLIDAAGQPRGMDSAGAPYKAMLERGNAIENPCGGLSVNPHSRHLLTRKGESSVISVVGPLAQGDVLIANNAPNNIAVARKLAEEMTEELLSFGSASPPSPFVTTKGRGAAMPLYAPMDKAHLA